MSPRSVSPPPASSHPESDLDSTAELPVLDPAVAAAPAADEHHTRTDTWVMPGPARKPAAEADAETVRQLEANLQSASVALQSVSQELQEARELLTNRGERVAQLERARDEAHLALAAAEQRAAALEQRLAALDAELLAQRQAGDGQHAALLDESQRARAAAEQRIAAVEQELTQARSVVGVAGEQAAELQRRLEQLESDSRVERSHEAQLQQAVLAQGRAHAASMMQDLHSERARAMGYLESLHSVEARRLIAESLITDLEREAETREADLQRLTRELAGHDGRARELSAELEQRAARIARLEQQLSTSGAMLEQRDGQLRDARTQAEGFQASVTRLQAEVTAAAERRQALELQLEQNHTAVSQQLAELQRLRSERSELSTALESARSGAATAAESVAARVALQDGIIAQHRGQTAQLEAALAAQRQRAAELESELATLRSEMEDWGGVLRSAQQERGDHLASIAAAEARVQALEHQAAEQRQNAIMRQADSDAHTGRLRELEAALRAAEETVRRLQTEAHERSARIEELEKSNQQWRTTAEETRHVLAETASNPALRDAARHLAEDGATLEPPPDGATRLLVQSDAGREIVHVLGRKTSIGRTPDNDLQIEAKFVSRHHAVILAGPAQTIIEDLNSTNGVQVNGRRVTRHTLRDGDQIAIGRAQYRFSVRKGGDKR